MTSRWMHGRLDKWVEQYSETYRNDEAGFKVAYENEKRKLFQYEMDDADFAALKKARQDMKAAIIRQQIADQDYEGIECLQEMHQALKNRRGNGGNIAPVYFVTINPKPGVTLEELKKDVGRFIRRAPLCAQYMYTYEQRGESLTDPKYGDGIHCHLLAIQKGGIFKGDFQKMAFNTFKHIVGNQQAVFVSPVRTKDLFESKVQYLLGNKTDEKMSKVAADRTWRTANNLEPSYQTIDFKWE